jgi:low temperature requirement protein LtrA
VHGLGNSRLHAPQPHRPLGSVSPASSGNDGSGAVYTAKELHALALAAVPNRVDSPAIDEDDDDIEAGRKETAGTAAGVASVRGATSAAALAAARSDGERDLASPSGHPPAHHPKSPSSNGWTGNQQNETGLASQSGVSTNGHGGSGGLLSPPPAVPAHAHSAAEPPSPSPVQQKLVLSEFAREMEARFGRPQHGFSRLKIRRDPFFSRPTLSHFLHRPQLKQYYRGVHTAGQLVLVRESQERRARWNELFFDLVFIVVFQRIGHQLHGAEHLDGRALCEFAVMFGAAWKTWIDLTLYVNQFDPTDTLHKVYFMLQMIFVMGLAVMSIKGVIGSYLMGTGLTLALRCWSAKYSPRAVQDAKAQVFVYFLGAAPWLASMAYPAPEDEDGQPIGRADLAHFQLWGVGLIIHYLGLFAFQCTARFHVPLNIEHITERMGIFTILCLGEMVLALLFTDVHGTSGSFLMAALGGALIFAVQILYYDVDGFNHKMHAVRNKKPDR